MCNKKAIENDVQREAFMELVYEELCEDPTNERANRIIDAYDKYKID